MRFCILLILASLIFSIGCSNDNNPISTVDNQIPVIGENDELESGTGTLGLFELHIDSETIDAELTPLRKTSLTDVLETVDITNFLKMAPCTDCAEIESISLDLNGNLVVSIGIRHPFTAGDPLKPISGVNRGDLHVFNVEGLVVSNALGVVYPGIGQTAAGINLIGIDGYSSYLDTSLDEIYPTDATIHPYMLHFDDYTAGNFDSSNPMGFASVTIPPPSGNLVMAMGSDYDYQDYVFDLTSSPIDLIYAIECTYAVSSASKTTRFSPEYRIPQHNKKAASEVSIEIISNDLRGEDTLSTAQVEIHVVDISHGVTVGGALDEMAYDSSVNEITMEIPGVMATPVLIDGSTPVSGSGHDPSDPLIYESAITNSSGALEGNYTGLIEVTDNYPTGENTSPLLSGMDGIKRVNPTENPLTGLFAISEFATYLVFSIDVATGNQLTLITPNGGESWDAYSRHDITWDSTGTVGNVMLEYSRDDFISDINVIEPDTVNDGIFNWFIPNDPTITAKVRISEVGNPLMFDISDADFTIIESTVPIWPYFGCDEKGRCLSTFNGTTSSNIKWTYSTEPVVSGPSIGPDGTLYCGIYKSNTPITSPGLVAINPDGSQKWMHFPAVGNYYGREPAVSADGQLVYYGGDAGAAGGYRGRIYCLNTSDGSQNWYYQLSSSYTGTHELIDGGPKMDSSGDIYFQSLRPMGIARMWSIDSSGNYKWHHSINGYGYSDMLHHSPAIGSDGYIYITDPGGQLWKFDSDGNSLWSGVYVNYATKWPGSLDDSNNFYVVCDDGRDVNKFAPDGTNLWTTPQWDFNLHCSPAHDSNGYIYATGGWESNGYRLRKMDPANGNTVWEHPLAAITTSMMAVSADGYIYIGCGNGTSYGPGLQCWDTSGNQVFNLTLPYATGSPAIGPDGTVYVIANRILYAIGD